MVGTNLNIDDLMGMQADKSRACFQQNVRLFLRLRGAKLCEESGEFQLELRIGHRFNNKVGGADRIPLDGILLHTGDKISITFPSFSRSR